MERNIIQIHLMFLFIILHCTLTVSIIVYSNTSYVLIYLGSSSVMLCLLSYSNTSYVLIYPIPFCRKCGVNKIQIHLMFLFIMQRGFICQEEVQIQIHLMFLFISDRDMGNSKGDEFKYILCSYLSSYEDSIY